MHLYLRGECGAQFVGALGVMFTVAEQEKTIDH